MKRTASRSGKGRCAPMDSDGSAFAFSLDIDMIANHPLEHLTLEMIA